MTANNDNKGAAGPENGLNTTDISSFLIQTDSGREIYYSQEDCEQQDVAGLIESAVYVHGQMCTVTAYHDHDGDDGYDILWEAPGHRAVQIARYGYDPDAEDLDGDDEED